MDKIARLSAGERLELFKSTALRKGMREAAVEKDFWVCWVLGRLFEHPELSRIILFKGGTSLAKVFHLIERFSEDIDLILDWRLLTKDNPKAKRSKTQQELFNEGINESAQVYIREKMLAEISRVMAPYCKAEINSEDPNIVTIKYPMIFTDSYLRRDIQLEIGPLAAWIPHGEYAVKSYAAEEFPEVFEKPDCKVRAIKAERTFWEKITILHQEAFRPENKPQPSGYSRHYYDTAMICRSPVKAAAIIDKALMMNVVEFKKKFYPRAWANYDKAVSGTFKLVPSAHVLDTLRKDYVMMESMIFGKYPPFDKIMEVLRELEKEINGK